MPIQPFCCDITSGTKEEQNQFKRLFEKASQYEWDFSFTYYGYDKNGSCNCWRDYELSIRYFTSILPLSEGILILKKMVGEEEKPEFNEAIEFGEWLRTFESLAKIDQYWYIESQLSTQALYHTYLLDRENWRKSQLNN